MVIIHCVTDRKDFWRGDHGRRGTELTRTAEVSAD